MFKKILIIRNDHIGDLVLSSSVFREIKRKFPKIKVTTLVSEVNKQIVEKNKNIDELIINTPFWREKTFSSFFKTLSIIKKIRKKKFDIGVDIRSSKLNMFFFLLLGGIKKRVSHYNLSGGKIFLTDPLFLDINVHATKIDSDLVGYALNEKFKNNFPDIVTNKSDQEELDKIIKRNSLQKFVCINPDASLEKKQWSLKNFDLIIKYLQKDYPRYKICLVGSDSRKINWLIKKTPNVCPLINQNLRVIFLLFKKSSLVIASDGGPMHIAWVAGAKLISFIPDYLNINHIGPLGKKSKVIHKKIDKITVKEVKDEIKKILN